jgi:predicted transcriptional regulator
MECQTNKAICLEAYANETIFDEKLTPEESAEVIRVAAGILAAAVMENKQSLKNRVKLLQKVYIAMENMLREQEKQKKKPSSVT